MKSILLAAVVAVAPFGTAMAEDITTNLQAFESLAGYVINQQLASMAADHAEATAGQTFVSTISMVEAHVSVPTDGEGGLYCYVPSPSFDMTADIPALIEDPTCRIVGAESKVEFGAETKISINIIQFKVIELAELE